MYWQKRHIKLLRWVKKYRIILLILAVAALGLLLILRGSKVKYTDFLVDLGSKMFSDDYAAVNGDDCLGKYQMGQTELQEAGFVDESGAWTPLANSYGIYSEEDFLASQDGQDAAVQAYHARTCAYILAMELDQYIGTTYCGVEVTRSGLLAACHLVGVVSMQNGLSTGEPVYDGNGVSAATYLETFAGYDVSDVWEEAE